MYYKANKNRRKSFVEDRDKETEVQEENKKKKKVRIPSIVILVILSIILSRGKVEREPKSRLLPQFQRKEDLRQLITMRSLTQADLPISSSDRREQHRQ